MAEKTWAVRGVPEAIAQQAVKAAQNQGMPVGKLVSDAIRFYLEDRPGDGRDNARISVGYREDIRAEVDDLKRRVEQLEGAKTRKPSGGPGRGFSPDLAQKVRELKQADPVRSQASIAGELGVSQSWVQKVLSGNV